MTKTKMHSKKLLKMQECREIAASRGGRCLSDSYVGNNIKMLWQCSDGHVWQANFGHIKNSNSWCPKCVGRDIYSIEDANSIAIKNQGKCLSTIFTIAAEKMQWQCKKGHVWWASFYKVRNGAWCKECLKYDLGDCQLYAQNKGGLCLSMEYINNKYPMLWQCSKGHIWERPFGEVKNKEIWCCKCNEDVRLKKCYEECIKLALERRGKCLSETYVSASDPMMWQCKNGHIWSCPFNYIKNSNYWCPFCARIISAPQCEIYENLINVFPDLNIILNDTIAIRPMDLDIYIPDLQVAIEYDGEYWHYSDWAIANGSYKRMLIKDEICKINKILLIRVRENRYKNNNIKIIEKIISILGSFE